MGYACPVCGAEQADAEHLANHLAVTASLGREDHSEWLEEYAPDWADRGPTELGEIVRAHAPEIDTPAFESTHGHSHESRFEDQLSQQTHQPGRGTMTDETQHVLRKARELTQQRDRSGTDDRPQNPTDDEPTENENA